MSDYDHLCKIVGNLYLQTHLDREKLLGDTHRAVQDLRARVESLERECETHAHDKRKAEAERDELLRALSGMAVAREGHFQGAP